MNVLCVCLFAFYWIEGDNTNFLDVALVGCAVAALPASALLRLAHVFDSLGRISLRLPLFLQAECSKYFSNDLLRPVAYVGRASTRRRLAERLGFMGNYFRCSPPPTSAAEEGRRQSDKRSHREQVSRAPSQAAAAATTTAIQEGEAGPAAASPEEGEEHSTGVAVEQANVVVTSYSILGTDADVLSGQVGCYGNPSAVSHGCVFSYLGFSFWLEVRKTRFVCDYVGRLKWSRSAVGLSRVGISRWRR